jgi:hypothetical protein
MDPRSFRAAEMRWVLPARGGTGAGGGYPRFSIGSTFLPNSPT